MVGLFLIFWLPYRVPVAMAWSDSYLFGYNNRAGEALFLALAVCLGAIAKVGGLVLPTGTRKAQTVPEELTYRVLLGCLGFSTFCAVGLYLLTHGVGGLNDGAYFLDRIHLIERGKVPYRDFEFVYGSFSLYASIYLGRVFSIGSVNGYYMLWLGETLTGVWLLWIFVRWIDIPGGGRRVVFLLTYALTLLYLLSIALNYCALRYTLPLFGMVAMCRVDQGSGLRRRVATVGLAMLLVTMLLGLSPEEGIAFACATVIYLPLRRYGSGRPFVVDLLILVPALVGAYGVAARAGSFGTMKGFAAGAFNLPIYPAPHLFFGFAAMLGVVCYLATGELRRRVQSNVCFVGIYGLGMVPGALGRCDTTHVGGYEMGMLLCAVLLCWRWPVLWRCGTWGFGLLFIMLPFAMSVVFSPPIYSKALLTQLYQGGEPRSALGRGVDRLATRAAIDLLGRERGVAKLQGLRASVAATSLDPRDVFPGSSGQVGVPLGYLPNKLSNYQSMSVDEGYFMGASNIVSPQQVAQKVSEMRDHPEQDLVVSPEGLEQCLVHVGSRALMEQLFLIPYVPEPKRTVSFFVPICTYIETDYYFVYPPKPSTFGYGLMRRKGAELPAKARGLGPDAT